MNLGSALKHALRRTRDLLATATFYKMGVARTVNGARLRVDWRTRHSFPPVYDRGVTDLLRQRLAPGQHCWNVGANVGVHALEIAKLVGPAGQVIAFEPNPHAAALLGRNLVLNRLDRRVIVEQVAIGERSGRTSFFVAGADPMSRPERPNPLLARTERLEVRVRTLDEILSTSARPPDCILIDIEGWEIGALLGAQNLVRLDPLPLLVVELHPNAWAWSGHSRQQLERLLESHRLQVEPLADQQDALSELGQVLISRRVSSHAPWSEGSQPGGSRCRCS